MELRDLKCSRCGGGGGTGAGAWVGAKWLCGDCLKIFYQFANTRALFGEAETTVVSLLAGFFLAMGNINEVPLAVLRARAVVNEAKRQVGGHDEPAD